MAIEHVPVAILGAGAAGHGAAYKTNELGRRAVVFEARSTAGGLLDNFTIDGLRWRRCFNYSTIQLFNCCAAWGKPLVARRV